MGSAAVHVSCFAGVVHMLPLHSGHISFTPAALASFCGRCCTGHFFGHVFPSEYGEKNRKYNDECSIGHVKQRGLLDWVTADLAS